MSLSGKNESAQSGEFQENLDMLRQIDFLSAFPLESLKVFAYLSSREVYKAGDTMFVQDEDDGQAFYIISGQTEVSRQEEGSELIFHQYTVGDFIGGLSLLGKMPRLFTMKAVTDTTCLVMQRDKFDKAFQRFADAIPRIFQAVVTNVARWEHRFLAESAAMCDTCKNHLGVSLL